MTTIDKDLFDDFIQAQTPILTTPPEKSRIYILSLYTI